MNAINTIPLTLLGLFVVFILAKKHKSSTDYALLIFTLILILQVSFDFNIIKENITRFKVFIHFNGIFWLSSAFLIYAYSLISKNKSIVVKWWFFAFSFPFLLYSFSDLILNSKLSQEDLHQILQEPNWVYQVFFKFHKVFVIAVCFLLLRLLKTYEIDLKNIFSSLENISLYWLRNYIILMICIYSFHLVVFLLYNFEILENIELPYTITGVATVLAALYLGFFGIKFYNLPVEKESNIKTETINIAKAFDENSTSVKIANSAFKIPEYTKSDENEIIFNQVKTLFKEEQIFKDPDLRIGKVADKINVPVHKVSEAINEQFEKPFYHFVAHYRCELLKEKLRDPENISFTILGLAMDVGFNSKSSLNRIFKEQTGQTPSQYKKSHLPK